jgi:nitrite reductase/ring-hydroxylating ferredoxin subunit
MSEFRKGIKVSDLPEGSMKTVNVGGEDVLLVNTENKFYAIGAICKHEEWDLSEGSLEGTKVICAGHGAIWDLTTGKPEFDEPLSEEPLYDVKIEDGYIYVRRR